MIQEIMKKIYKILTLVILLTGLISCEDYLNEVPKHSLTGSTAITDYSKAQAAVNGIYSSMSNDDNWNGGLYVALASKSGFVDFSSANYNMDYTQEDGTGDRQWTSFYRTLNYANFAIKGINALGDESFPSLSAKEALIGEARALRAYTHLQLLWNFSHWWAGDDDEYGILYRDEPVELSNMKKARSTVGESYEKIFEDLDYAIEKMESFTSPRYFSKEFAKIIKAKALLYRGGYNNNTTDLQSALTLVNDVMATAPGAFEMEDDMQEMYDNSWDSKENLFVRYLENDNHYGGYWYPYGIIYQGDRLPLSPGQETTAGINYGLDWFKADGRWDIATGESRAPETWDNSQRYTFVKLSRKGSYLGRQEGSPADKYAVYHFRYAELYLMKSELLARTGADITTAIAPINEMRANRTNPSLPALSPASQDELMELIFREYWMELCLENGSEFFASVRFKKNGVPFIEIIKNKTLNVNKMCWPIPTGEMDNNDLMVQNIGLE